MKLPLGLGLTLLSLTVNAAPYPDRFVWIFGWSLENDSSVAQITELIETTATHNLNGAMASFGLDTLCKRNDAYFTRLNQVKSACETNNVDLIPAIFSVGYGGGTLSHNRNLAEGLPVRDVPFVVHEGRAAPLAVNPANLLNGDFEAFKEHRLKDFNFHDQPGEVSFVDQQVFHGGKASLRMENFSSNPHGHGRIMQEITVQPHRVYRVSLWVKTEELQPVNAFQVTVLAGARSLAPRTFQLQPTQDWQKLTMLFNSLEFDSVRIYAGLWGGRSGKIWIDDWSIEEPGPINVLHRPGTPVTVQSANGSTTYTEGVDFAPLVDHDYSPYLVDHAAPNLKLLPGSRIQEGQHLRVSWYHTLLVHDSQITLCMAEPALYEIFDHEAQLLAQHLNPKRVMLNMDEVRLGGTCEACRGRNMGQLLGECVTRQVEILRRYLPAVQVYVWSDMLDPHHNAHGNYYLVNGDFTGSWNHIPKDLTIAVWGGEPRENSLRFFADHGFPTLVACYYDADDLTDVEGWLNLAKPLPGVQGFMYTPWLKRYNLLPEFGDLLHN